MDRPFDPGDSLGPDWADGDETAPFGLDNPIDDEDEEDQEEEEAGTASAGYGSLLGLGATMRRKKPCIVLDAEEAENAVRLVQHIAAHQLSGDDAGEADLWADAPAMPEPEQELPEPTREAALTEPAPAESLPPEHAQAAEAGDEAEVRDEVADLVERFPDPPWIEEAMPAAEEAEPEPVPVEPQVVRTQPAEPPVAPLPVAVLPIAPPPVAPPAPIAREPRHALRRKLPRPRERTTLLLRLRRAARWLRRVAKRLGL